MARPRTILHVDMDAFYASVEQLDRPECRGRPVVVGADPRGGRGRGVGAACSYEARAVGIHSALPIGRAWQRCPDAVFLRPRMDRYAEISRRVFAVFGRYTDRVEPLSIDEAFLDLTGTERLLGPARAAARRLKDEIRREVGLVASVGLAPNKFLAKVASDLDKPDGFVVVRPGEEAAFLAPLPVRRLWGVGPRTAAALERLGMRSVGDLARWRRDDLRARFGELGDRVWALSRGIDDRPVEPGGAPRSVGAEHTFEEDATDPDAVRRTLLRLADKVAARLRRAGRVAGGVTLKLRDGRFRTVTRAARLAAPTDVGADLYAAALGLLGAVPSWRTGRPVRLVGIAATRLAPRTAAAGGQLDLFAPAPDGRRRAVALAVDRVHDRFGSRALRRAVHVADEDG